MVAVDWAQQALKEAGDLVLADPDSLPPGKLVQLSELVTGAATGRRDDRDITVYKSVGVGLQDVALAGPGLATPHGVDDLTIVDTRPAVGSDGLAGENP